MQTIRLQNLTPNVYTDESRDFQVLCRLFDSVFNGIKYDSDTIKYIVDTKNIQSSLLPLLQTKLGFLTKKKLNDNEIRYILRVFPELVRNKGSLNAIRKLINICLKLNDISGEFTISYSDTATVINGIMIDAHTIIVGIDSVLNSTELITEIARYILPAGFSFYIYYYKNYNTTDDILYNQDVKLLYSSSNLNAQVRGTRDNSDGYTDYTMPLPDESMSYNLLGSVDVAWINSVDSEISDNFLGIFESFEDLPQGENENIAIALTTVDNVVYPDVYYYNDSIWNKLDFRGYCELSSSNPQVSNPQNYDVVCTPHKDKYLVYQTSAWVECTYRGLYNSETEVSNPQENDIIILSTGQSAYKIYKSGSWIDVNYKATYSNASQVNTDYEQNNNLIILNGGTYYLYVDNAWTIITDTIYMLKKVISEDDELGE